MYLDQRLDLMLFDRKSTATSYGSGASSVGLWRDSNEPWRDYVASSTSPRVEGEGGWRGKGRIVIVGVTSQSGCHHQI